MIHSNDLSRLEINIPACVENFRHFRASLRPSTKILILAKANGYGHGAEDFSRVMEEAGADWLGVALPYEGVRLRKAGIKMPILVLTTGMERFNDIIDYSLEPGIPSLNSLKALCSVLKERGLRDFPVHISIDTGMHRLGLMPDEIPALTEYLKDCPYVHVSSLYSHLAASDDPQEDEFTLLQLRRFREYADSISREIGYKPMYHILNSAGIERFPEYQMDMVRLGIGVYGFSALPDVRLTPAGALRCKILQIKNLEMKDGTIGYGRQSVVSHPRTRIATIPLGYADGLDRRLGCGAASFSVNGHRAPTIGRICMDMCMIDVSDIPDVKEGDVVTIFGDDPRCDELARIIGTIPYEIMTRINIRVRRIVVR